MARRSRGSPHRWAPHRLALLVALGVALAAGALIGVAWSIGFQRILSGLAHPHWPWLAAAVAGELLAYLGYTAAYREVARAEHGAELQVPEAAALVATGFGVFVHGGGFALDREALQHAGLGKTDARRRVLGLGALEYAVLAPATLVAASIVLLRHEPVSKSLTLPWVVGVPLGAALALTALRFDSTIRRSRHVGEPIGHALGALGLLFALSRSPRRHGLAFLGSLAYWSGDVFCLWATLHAFSAHTPPAAQLIVGYSTGYAVTRRALPLGGAGIVEALLPFALGWVKIALAPALLAVFAYRLINLWLPMIPAFAGVPTMRRLEGARRRRRAPAEPRRAGT